MNTSKDTMKIYPTQTQLHKLFDYDKGNLRWLHDQTANKVSKQIAGTQLPSGYIAIGIDNKQYLAHRLIWIYHNGDIPPNTAIDHKNTTKNDNHIENLRLVTTQENGFNRNAKGYSYYPNKINPYRARICFKKQFIDLGQYKTKEEAHNAYLQAKEKYHQLQRSI